jgi:hypothetical protein
MSEANPPLVALAQHMRRTAAAVPMLVPPLFPIPSGTVDHLKAPRAAALCRDLHFVAVTAAITKCIRRPLPVGTCAVIGANTHAATAAVYAAAMHLQARLVQMSTGFTHARPEHTALMTTVCSMANVLADGQPVVLLVEASSLFNPDSVATLQAWLCEGSAHHLVTPELFAQCFNDDTLQDAMQLLLPGITLSEVRVL